MPDEKKDPSNCPPVIEDKEDSSEGSDNEKTVDDDESAGESIARPLTAPAGSNTSPTDQKDERSI